MVELNLTLKPSAYVISANIEILTPMKPEAFPPNFFLLQPHTPHLEEPQGGVLRDSE